MTAAPPARPGALCRHCGWRLESAAAVERPPGRCPACASPKIVAHSELFSLTIGHVDCDAFYASVEKRDHPELREKALIIGGGGDRGVVTTACYLARIHGVRSAMPMVEARRRCPQAAILPPDLAKYAAVSREIRALMDALTPLVEPLSLDEAFLDLTGAERLHGMPAAASLAGLARRVSQKIGVTLSVGLAPNKFLAKIASDLDKPSGFAVIGRAEALAFLADKPVSLLWGVGPATVRKLAADGFRLIRDLRAAEEADLLRRYGALGQRLARLSRGEDARDVDAARKTKSVSAETTFQTDLDIAAEADWRALDAYLWRLSEKVSARMKKAELVGRVAQLALKTARHQRLTRRRALSAPSQSSETLYAVARSLLEAEREAAAGGGAARRFRLIGVGFGEVEARSEEAEAGDGFAALLDPAAGRKVALERTMDRIRDRFGDDALRKGRGLKRD